VPYVALHKDALTLAFLWIWISRKLKVVFSSIVFTSLKLSIETLTIMNPPEPEICPVYTTVFGFLRLNSRLVHYNLRTFVIIYRHNLTTASHLKTIA
jgi:hypothetical protein